MELSEYTKSWREGVNATYELLDQIDIEAIYKKNPEVITLGDLMSAIEDDPMMKDFKLPKDFEGYLFNFIDQYEFGMYLERRYESFYFREILRYEFFW